MVPRYTSSAQSVRQVLPRSAHGHQRRYAADIGHFHVYWVRGFAESQVQGLGARSCGQDFASLGLTASTERHDASRESALHDRKGHMHCHCLVGLLYAALLAPVQIKIYAVPHAAACRSMQCQSVAVPVLVHACGHVFDTASGSTKHVATVSD